MPVCDSCLPQVQEQPTSSREPPAYKGYNVVDPITLDCACLFEALETGGFKLGNTQINQNLVLHHLGAAMTKSAIFLQELCCMVGSPYHPAVPKEISWRDLQWVKVNCWGVPTREEVVEDKVTREVTMLVLPVDHAEDEEVTVLG